MPSPLRNPYPPVFRQHSVFGKISDADFDYIETLFGAICTNLHDAIVSTLYAGLIRHLRDELNLSVPDDCEWDPDGPAISKLRDALSQFLSSGGFRPSHSTDHGHRPVSPRHDPGAASGVCSAGGEPPKERIGDEEGHARQAEGSTKKKEKRPVGRRRSTGAGVPVRNSEELLKELKKQKIP